MNIAESYRNLLETKPNDHQPPQNTYCLYCKRKLVPIGYNQYGGVNHNDWSNRKYHKKCFLEKTI